MVETRLVKKGLLCSVLALLFCASSGAADFGLLLSPSGGYGSGTDSAGFTLGGTLVPWFSASIGENMNLYLSGKLTLKGFEYGKKTWVWPPLVELGRTELSFRPTQTVYLTLGRQQFRDISGTLVSGFFDGLAGNIGLGKVRLSCGVYYTGWLYKGTAEILMTQQDNTEHSKALDYGDFLNTYPASSRMLVSVTGDFPDLSSRTSLVLSVLGQFDLNDYEDSGDAALHSQYLAASYSVELVDPLRFTVTGVGGLMETSGMDTELCLAAIFGADWEVSGRLADMLSAKLSWGSGAVNKFIGPFRPVSGIAQGFVFTPTLSGTMNGQVSYAARLHRTLSFSTAGLVFWRTDVQTFKDTELNGASTDRFLGTEFYGQLVWAPESALHFSVGGGVFLPGGAFVADASPRWNVNMELVVSL
jgi:hypothetical protein